MTPPENDLRDAVARDYVLVKRGLYYRPDSLGYTGVLDDAGRYTAEDAKFHNDHCSDVKGILVSEAPRFSSACWPEIITRTLEADLAKARADLERVTAERDEAVEMLAMTATAHSISETEAEEEAETLLSGIQAVAAARDAAEAENTRLRALLVDAGEALRPLADAASHHEHTHDDACVIAIPGRPGRDQPRVGQLRRARTTLAALDKAPTPKEPA